MQTDKIDRTCVQQRISDWNKRLNGLYDKVEQWAKEYGDHEALRTDIPQAREDLMIRFDIEQEPIPALAIRFGRQRVSFVPMGLWVIGSNGRVNITTNQDKYILVDMGGQNGTPSHWMIVDPSKRNRNIDFDRSVLHKLIEGENIF